MIQFANKTTGQIVPVVMAPPPDANYQGESAQWIVESPNGGYVNATGAVLPNFEPIQFTAAFACNNRDSDVPNPNAVMESLDVDETGNRITKTELGFFSTTVDYVGP